MKSKSKPPSNREVDILIATHVMGITPDRDDGVDYYEGHCDPKQYSTDLVAAWTVIDKLRNTDKRAFALVTFNDRGTLKWLAKWELWGTDGVEFAAHESAPMAICLSVLELLKIPREAT